MSIECIGLLSLADGSEANPAAEKFNPGFVRTLARAYEEAGYDRVLVAQTARCADSMVVANWVAASTERLKLMIAHRPGFIAPTMAARMLAALDQFSGGRCGVHIITAASDLEIQNDGDFSGKEERYARSVEYVGILRRIWSSGEPFDHEGSFYRFVGGFSEVKPVNGSSIPVFWGGTTAPGIEGAGACADIYAIGGGTVARTSDMVDQVKTAARRHGRELEFCMSIRLIMADTHDQAWDRANDILNKIVGYQSTHGFVGRDQGEYNQRRVAQALAYKESSDPCLWTALTEATKGRSTVLSLVGTPDELAAALLRYHAVGIDRFLITGYDPIGDARYIGRELIPQLKAGATERRQPGERSAFA